MGKKDLSNDCPVIKVEGETLPEVWEKSVMKCWQGGIAIRTEYDKAGDPPSRDCTMIMEVTHPFKEPRLHRAFPAGLEDLEIYRQEVIFGIHDDWIKPEEGKWEYTYHERLFNYKAEGKSIDQIDYLVRKLSETPYTRRAQAVTWKAWLDPECSDSPCMQRFWLRIFEDRLQLNVHFRSNDAFKAAFMNMFAFTELQKVIAEKISEKIDKKINVGKYLHIADSYHIYGSYYQDFKGFLDTLKKRSFEERTWSTSFAEPFFEEGRKRLKRDKKGNFV